MQRPILPIATCGLYIMLYALAAHTRTGTNTRMGGKDIPRYLYGHAARTRMHGSEHL